MRIGSRIVGLRLDHLESDIPARGYASSSLERGGMSWGSRGWILVKVPSSLDGDRASGSPDRGFRGCGAGVLCFGWEEGGNVGVEMGVGVEREILTCWYSRRGCLGGGGRVDIHARL